MERSFLPLLLSRFSRHLSRFRPDRIDLLSAIRRDVHLLRIIDRDLRRVAPQIT